MHVRIHLHIFICTRFTHVSYLFIYICTRMQTPYTCTYTCIFVYRSIHVYMHICTCIFLHIHMQNPVWIPPKAENARNAAGEFRPGTPYLCTCHTHACLADMRTYILTCDNVNTCLHSYIQTYKHTYILAYLLCGLQKHQILQHMLKHHRFLKPQPVLKSTHT